MILKCEVSTAKNIMTDMVRQVNVADGGIKAESLPCANDKLVHAILCDGNEMEISYAIFLQYAATTTGISLTKQQLNDRCVMELNKWHH